MMKNQNPIITEFIQLKLIEAGNLIEINDRTRDSRHKVFRDKKTDIIVLEKFLTGGDYYEKNASATPEDNFFTENQYFPDDMQRFEEHKEKLSKVKRLVDVGCEWGGFLNIVSQNRVKAIGVEPNLACRCYVEQTFSIDCKANLDELNEYEADFVTLFHVLEHVPSQLNFLKSILKIMASGGRLVIEVPHARDMLLDGRNLKSYKNFIFWNEHLVLHTQESLEAILMLAGFKIKETQYKQRYGFPNHLEWFMNGQPGGHIKNANMSGSEFDNSYRSWIVSNKNTDTIVVIAEKP